MDTKAKELSADSQDNIQRLETYIKSKKESNKTNRLSKVKILAKFVLILAAAAALSGVEFVFLGKYVALAFAAASVLGVTALVHELEWFKSYKQNSNAIKLNNKRIAKAKEYIDEIVAKPDESTNQDCEKNEEGQSISNPFTDGYESKVGGQNKANGYAAFADEEENTN